MYFLRPKSVLMSIFKYLRHVKPKTLSLDSPRRRNINRGSCHTLILDLKNTRSNFFFVSDHFKFTVSILQLLLCHKRAFCCIISNFVTFKSIQSVFLHYKPFKRVSRTVACFPAFLFQSFAWNHTKGYFGHFPQWNPFSVPAFVSESFQFICTNHWSNCAQKSS